MQALKARQVLVTVSADAAAFEAATGVDLAGDLPALPAAQRALVQAAMIDLAAGMAQELGGAVITRF